MNFSKPAGMYGRAEVDNRVREFEQGRKDLTEHALDMNTKNHSPERGRRAEKEVLRDKLQKTSTNTGVSEVSDKDR